MERLWTLPELVDEVATRISALPAPRNGQVRAVPDDRTVRYYATLGLLDRPSAMRGRTALYGRKHAAQVVAIKRLQNLGRSLSEIQALWPTLDDRTLARMSGVALDATAGPRTEFWKRVPQASSDASAGAGARAAVTANPDARPPAAAAASASASVWASSSLPAQEAAALAASELASSSGAAAVELRIELAPHVVLSLSVVDDGVAISPADVHALRAAAAPLLTELARRRLALHLPASEETKP